MIKISILHLEQQEDSRTDTFFWGAVVSGVGVVLRNVLFTQHPIFVSIPVKQTGTNRITRKH
jgi:hypothetical protein